MPNTDITRIAGNIGALNALNSLQWVNNQLAVHQTRLSTGRRLNEAADDPAGFNMALTFDIRRGDMKVALNAIGDAKNMLAIAETGIRKIADILVKMKNKVMESAGATLGDQERKAIVGQLNQYTAEIQDIVEDAEWNGNTLLDSASKATGGSSLDFFIGVSGKTGSANFAEFKFTGSGSAGFEATTLGLAYDEAVSTIGSYVYTDIEFGKAGSAGEKTLTALSAALDSVKGGIVDLGSMASRLTFKEDAVTSAYINTEAAYNRIMNANMAEEQVNASKFLILQQTAVAMLAQANMAPQFLLTLFR